MSNKYRYIFIILSLLTPFMSQSQTLTMLSLGDSYTIGEAVQANERFPMQTVAMMQSKRIAFTTPTIIAKTGWTTNELQAAIDRSKLTGTYDAVTLLIGVNNQYQGLSREVYRREFNALLQQAIVYAKGKTNHVFVVSIPDWGVTPFAHGKNKDEIGADIDAFNAINKAEAELLHCHYIDITPESRLAEADRTLIATDGLHPSAKMYAEWSAKLSEAMQFEYSH